jgi:hypothetical protein
MNKVKTIGRPTERQGQTKNGAPPYFLKMGRVPIFPIFPTVPYLLDHGYVRRKSVLGPYYGTGDGIKPGKESKKDEGEKKP